MANELRHKDVGTALSKAEWEDVGSHIFNSQAAGDIVYASSTTQLTRLGIGSAKQILVVNSGGTAPEWTSSPPVVTALVPDAADGATIGTAALEFSDIYLADGAVLNFGNDQDVTLTHVADAGLLLNSDNYVTFRDSALKIHSSADGQLDIDADTEVEITATTIDINGAVALNGAITGVTSITASATIQAEQLTTTDDITVGDTASIDGTLALATGLITDSTGAISFDNENLTTTGSVTAASLDISGSADIDGTMEADAYTVNGTTLAEYIADTSGAMFSSNTETGITVTYQDGDNTVDLVVGTLNQDTTGTADNITASANNSTDETVYPTFVDGATGSQGIETDTGLTYNPSSGIITATQFTGAVSGNVTGTLQTAAQGNITSLGTLTALTVDSVAINGTTIGHTSDTDLMTLADGVLTVAGELDATTLDISGNADIDGTLEADAYTVDGTTLAEYIADTAGAMVTGNTESGITVAYQDADNTIDFTVGTLNQDTTGTAATVTTAAQPNITSLGTLTTLTVDNVIINGTTIGHTSDTDLITIADGAVTIAGNLSVTGTQTIVDTVTMNAENAIVFEGASADAYETTLTIVDPTADHTYYLPDLGSSPDEGWIAAFAVATGTSGLLTATPAELNIMDGGTSATSTTLADADRIVVNDNGTMVQVALTDLETYMETSLDTLSNVTTVGTIGSGTWEGTTIAVDQGGTGATSLNNLITLATHTTGNYVATITGGTGLTSTAATSGEGTTHSLSVDAAQTGITSIYATDLIIGEDSETAIDFGTVDEIDFKINNSTELTLSASALYPVTDAGLDLGTSSLEFKDAFFDGTVTSDAFAGPLTGDVTGNADTATLATTVTITDNESTNESNALIFTAGGDVDGGNLGLESDGTLTYNPSTGKVTATGFVGTLAGAVTGNVTGNADTATALASAVNIGGTSFDGTGNIAVALASVATAVTITDNESTNEDNAVVFTAGGDVDGGNLGLESDGNLIYNPSTGRITATQLGGTVVTATQNSITTMTGLVTTGTIGTGVWEATDVAVAHGGTGVSTLTDGGVLLGNGTGDIVAMSVLTDGQMIVGDGTTDPVAESGATLRTSIGVGTGDSPTFTGLTLTGALALNGDSITSDGDLTVNATGNVFIADHLKPNTDDTYDLGDTTYAWRTLHLEGDLYFMDAGTIHTGTGTLTIDGDDGITLQTTGAGNVTVGEILDITDSTDASDATGDTGALRTEGGASIAKKLYVGTDLDVDGTAELDNVTIGGDQGDDGQVLTSTGSGVAWEDAAGGGIEHYSEWVITSDLSTSSADITSNWAELSPLTYTTYERIGSAMSESSGVFTFPATGKWEIRYTYHVNHISTSSRYTEMTCKMTDDNSNYQTIGSAMSHMPTESGSRAAGAYQTRVIDVVATGTHKVKFNVSAENTCNWLADSGRMRTGVSFKYLAAT